MIKLEKLRRQLAAVTAERDDLKCELQTLFNKYNSLKTAKETVMMFVQHVHDMSKDLIAKK